MSPHPNPFLRDYQNLHISRSLFITYEDDCPPAWRPLHPSQAHLSDDQVAHFPCFFNDDFALITEGQEIPDELEAQCQSEGVVRTVVYAVNGDDFGQPVHVGDTYAEDAAREVVRRLRFETGHYSRCWEISTAHITEDANRYLEELADIATPTGFLFVAFRIPYSPAIGVKLIATPWTDTNLEYVEGISTEQLRQEHLSKCMPESLVEVLHLAALADVRMLVFDADASNLDGLKLYDE
ncbi:ABC transporter substrate-binding protein [Pseudomonas mandelii]|uniref:DUF5983 family protein n=1 Tax=Pseudomonas TaxID=286 RepID=UPI00034314B1|nr:MULTISPECIES: hypothetical protein [unclassified Pseudomonas]EPA95396.1 hypothetical protein PG5_41240 [Pseudomonas sp. G5(2012)]OOL37129.1 ABC transporter substrate-binding protein [Pseudomonas sp. FSL W5-0299]